MKESLAAATVQSSKGSVRDTVFLIRVLFEGKRAVPHSTRHQAVFDNQRVHAGVAHQYQVNKMEKVRVAPFSINTLFRGNQGPSLISQATRLNKPSAILSDN